MLLPLALTVSRWISADPEVSRQDSPRKRAVLLGVQSDMPSLALGIFRKDSSFSTARPRPNSACIPSRSIVVDSAMTQKRLPPDSPRPALQRYDRPGHIDPAHAERLLAKSGAARAKDDAKAFVEPSSSEDDFAEELGETAVAAMTSGEDALTEDLETPVDEERGGPFVETRGSVEFASGTDESNTEDAMREPIPLANHEQDDEEEEDE